MQLFDRTGKPIRHARNVRYDNTVSGLLAKQVQAALDELAAQLGAGSVGVQGETLSGAVDDLALDPGIGFLEVDTGGGAARITGIVAERDGQILIISCAGANALTIAALDDDSASANQIRAASDLTLLEGDSLTLRYSAQIEKWVVMS